jgi:hypothetical protein
MHNQQLDLAKDLTIDLLKFNLLIKTGHRIDKIFFEFQELVEPHRTLESYGITNHSTIRFTHFLI